MSLLFSVYEREDDGLRLYLTGQSLRLVTRQQTSCQFEYADADIVVPLSVRLVLSSYNALIVVVDFNRDGQAAVVENYGLWRRMSYFLLDSLAVWFHAIEVGSGRFWHVSLIGGWRNGQWEPNSMLQLARLNDSGPARTFVPMPFALVPLTMAPPRWQYHSGAAGRVECALAVRAQPGVPIPILEPTQSIEAQLENVPHFVRNDNTARIFHRYVSTHFNRGEDYAPLAHYGYHNEECGFTFSALEVHGVMTLEDPILISSTAVASEWFRFDEHTGRYLGPKPRLREELFFGLADIGDLVERDSRSGRTYPLMTERDPSRLAYYAKEYPGQAGRWSGIRFGAYGNMMSESPVSNGLGLVDITTGHVYGPRAEYFQRAPTNGR